LIDDRPKLKWLSIDQLELWEEANVRKSGSLVNIEDLARNIQQNGLRVPLLAKEHTPNKLYLVFSGQRRLTACKMAGKIEVPVFVWEKISLNNARILSLSENLYREAMAIDDISDAADALYQKFDNNLDRVSIALGVKPSTVKRYLGYKAVYDELKELVRQKKITAQQAIDIYTKFPEKKRELEIAKELGAIKERNKKTKFHSAVKQSNPSDDIKKIRERADKLIHMKIYKILLPDANYKTIEKIALVRKVSAQDILIDIIEQWTTEYDRGEHRF
jgi:ParB/RepB/Spo0J family partition protein